MNIGAFTFNGFDVVVILVLLISLIIALQRGFAREVLSLLSLFIAGFIALFVWGRYRFDVQELINPAWLADVALGAGTFLIIYLLAVFLLSRLFSKLEDGSLGIFNRLLGAIFGVLRGLILAALAVMVLTASHRSSNEAQEFREYIAQNRANLPADIMEKMPESMKEQMKAAPKPLPPYLANSTFYPLLNNIGNVIRDLPFAEMKSYADRLKSGELYR